MHSFDFFDTLVARRHIFPFTDESDPQPKREEGELIPIMDNVRRVQPGDIVVSDFYLPKEWIQAQLKRVTGLENEVFVSRDGKETGEIWRRLKKIGLLPQTHTGDDQRLDVNGPPVHGIQGIRTDTHRPTGVEQGYIDIGLPDLAYCIREARLSCHDPKYPEIQAAQTQANFPMLAAATVLLERWAEANSLTRLLLSSRDGYLWYLLARTVLKRVDVRYFMTSRIARVRPSNTYLDYVGYILHDKTGVVDLCGTGYSIRRLSEYLFQRIPLLLLAWYGDGQNQEYESLKNTNNSTPDYLIKTSLAELEIANYANQDMVIDIRNDGSPVTLKTEFDWVGCREIDTAHNAFLTCVKALNHYNTMVQLRECDDPTLTGIVEAACLRLGQYWEYLSFARDAHRAEELQIRRIMGFREE